MAKIFDKTTTGSPERTLLIDQREGLVYPIPYKDWNLIRVGITYSVTNSSEDNGSCENVTQSISPILSMRDRVFIGLKSSSSNFPGENGEPFIGIMSNGTIVETDSLVNVSEDYLTVGANFANRGIRINVVGANGVIDGSNSSFGPVWHLGKASNFDETSGFSRKLVLTFQMKNKGLSTQSIAVSHDSDFSDSSDVSDQGLINAMVGTMEVEPNDKVWNLSGVPYPIPDALFFYLPFTTLRLRLHNVAVMKVS